MLHTPDPREDPDPNYQPLLDTKRFFIETRSSTLGRRTSPRDLERSIAVLARAPPSTIRLVDMPSGQSDRSLDPELEQRLAKTIIGDRQPGPVVLVEYRADWVTHFERIRKQLARALGASARTIEHIGSTAVPEMPAKPIIDVLVTVDEVEDEYLYLPVLVGLGYEPRVREPGHRMFRPSSRDAHIHVWAEGSAEHRDYLLLRDRLRASPEDHAAYARLKHQLVSEDWPDVNYYAEAKSPLIAEILERATR